MAESKSNTNNIFRHSNFRLLIVFLLFIITLFNYIDRSAIAYAIQKFQLTPNEEGLLLGSFGIGYAVTTFLGGIWVDRYGPKNVLFIAVIMWAVSMFLTASMASFAVLLSSRTLLGLSEGPNFPALTRAQADWLSAKERARALSYGLMAVPIALAIGGPIITQLIEHLGWAMMFVVLGVVVIVWLPFWLWLFKNNPADSPFVDGIELAKITQDEKKLLHHEMFKHISWRFMLTNKTLLANYWAFFVFGYYLFFFLSWLPSYLQYAFQLSIKQEGLFTIFPWFLSALLIWVMGILSDKITQKTSKLRYSRSYPILISQLLASVIIIPLAIMHHINLTTAIILISFALGFSMSANANYYAVNIDIAKQRAGTALGIMDTFFAIAGFIAPALTGIIVNDSHRFTSGFVFLIILGLSSVITVFFFHHPDSHANYPRLDVNKA